MRFNFRLLGLISDKKLTELIVEEERLKDLLVKEDIHLVTQSIL